MDKSEIWDVLHDGGIKQISLNPSGDVRMVVEIAYLREMFPEPGTTFIVDLKDCRLVEYRRLLAEDTEVVCRDWADVLRAEPSILHGRDEHGTVVVGLDEFRGPYCELRMTYDSFKVFLESGREVSYQELVDACKRYWDAFGHR